MKDKKIMAVPFGCFLGVIAVCLVGSLICLGTDRLLFPVR